MYVCMHACMHACMHVCMYVCMYVMSLRGEDQGKYLVPLLTLRYLQCITYNCITYFALFTVRYLQ